MSDRARPPSRSLLATVGSISLATSFSRILGLVREQTVAYFFGAGLVTDAFYAAFRIPNLLRDLFAEGALSAAFVPTFTKAKEQDGLEAAWRLANRLITLLVLVLGVVTLVIFVFAPQILAVYSSGFDDDKLALAVPMARIMAAFLLFVALAAVAMGMLNSLGRFFLPAFSPATFNVSAILAIIALTPILPRFGLPSGLSLAIGAIVGGAMQFVVQLPALRREGFRFRPEWAPDDPGIRRIFHLMGPATFGLAATQINLFVDTSLASQQGDGPISYLQFAFRLMQLPLGLFGVAIATANTARVAHDAARADRDGMRRNVASSLRAAALLTLPATAGLIVLREPIIRVLFERGAFGPRDTVMTAGAVLCYALGLYAYSATKIQAPTFYALGDTRTPVVASAVAVAVKIAASFALLALLPVWGAPAFLGLALSTSLAAWTNFAQLTVGLRRHLGSFRGLRVVPVTLQVVVVSAVMGVACGALHRVAERWIGGGGLAGEVARLLTVVAAGAAVSAVGAYAIGVPEARALWSRVRGRPAPRNDGT